MLAAAASRAWRDTPTLPAPGADFRENASRLLAFPAATVFRRMFSARLPAVAIGLLAVVVAGLWGRRIGGTAGGLAAAAFLASSTLYGAHAHLITADVATASLTFSGAYFLLRPLGRGLSELATTVLGGALLGLGMTSKFSALFLAAALLPLAAWELRAGRRAAAARIAGGYLAAGLTVIAVLSFASRRTSPSEVRDRIAEAAHGGAPTKLSAGAFPFLLRAADEAARISPGVGRFFLGAAVIASPAFASAGHPVFFHGRITTRGNFWYFPAGLLFKWGTSFALAALGGLGLALFGKGRRLPPAVVWLPILFFAVVIPSHYQLGARYLLPMYPFLALWPAALAGLRVGRAVLVAAAACSLFAAAWSFPEWMGDSSLAGRMLGPIEQWFAGANLDWGQDLRRIQRAGERAGWRVAVVGGSEFGELDRIFPGLDFPEARDPLPRGRYYSVTRWGPFLETASRPEYLRLYPPEYRPMLRLLDEEFRSMRGSTEIPSLSSASMRGFFWEKAP